MPKSSRPTLNHYSLSKFITTLPFRSTGIAIILLVLYSCVEPQSQQERSFEGKRFFIAEFPQWEMKAENYFYSALVMQDDQTWVVMFPGGLSQTHDTLYVHQEAGYPNTCVSFGALAIDDSAQRKVGPHEIAFWLRLDSDSLVYLNNRAYVPTEYPVKDFNWCNWE